MRDHTQDQFMQQAIKLAEHYSESGKNGQFGAVIVKNQEVIAQGWNQVVELHDCTAHAEIMAIRKAAQKLGAVHLHDCVLYSSCEPCPMCLSAAYWAHVDKIYFSATRIDAAAADFNDDEIYLEINKPLMDRKIPCIQLLPEDGKIVFQRWIKNTNKIQY